MSKFDMRQFKPMQEEVARLREQNAKMLDILTDIHVSHTMGVNMYDVIDSRMSEISQLIAEVEHTNKQEGQ